MAELRSDPISLVVDVPIAWLARLCTVHRSRQVWITALIVLHWQTVTQRSSFWVSSTDLFPMFEMSRHAIRRALDRLATLGLIRVDRARGHMPWVTVLTSAAEPLETPSAGAAATIAGEP